MPTNIFCKSFSENRYINLLYADFCRKIFAKSFSNMKKALFETLVFVQITPLKLFHSFPMVRTSQFMNLVYMKFFLLNCMKYYKFFLCIPFYRIFSNSSRIRIFQIFFFWNRFPNLELLKYGILSTISKS